MLLFAWEEEDGGLRGARDFAGCEGEDEWDLSEREGEDERCGAGEEEDAAEVEAEDDEDEDEEEEAVGVEAEEVEEDEEVNEGGESGVVDSPGGVRSSPSVGRRRRVLRAFFGASTHVSCKSCRKHQRHGRSELHPTLAALQLMQADLVLFATGLMGTMWGCWKGTNIIFFSSPLSSLPPPRSSLPPPLYWMCRRRSILLLLLGM